MMQPSEVRKRIADLLDERMLVGSVSVHDLTAGGVLHEDAVRALEEFPKSAEGKAFMTENDIHLTVVIAEGEVALRPEMGFKSHMEFGLTSESTGF